MSRIFVRRLLSGRGLVAALVLSVGLPAGAFALATEADSGYDPGVPPGVTEGDFAESGPSTDAIGQIQAAAGKQLTGVIPDRRAKVIRVLVKFPVPAGLTALASQGVAGYKIEVREARFSQEELLVAADVVLRADRSGGDDLVHAARGIPDGSGLTLFVGAGTLKDAAEIERLGTKYRQLTQMRIAFAQGQAPVTTSRANDYTPWSGGSVYEHPGFNPPGDVVPFNFCSTAFAVVTATGSGRLLSARHCDQSNSCNTAFTDGGNDAFTQGGDDVDCAQPNDTMLIDPVGGTQGWVHGGPWNATLSNNRFRLKVALAARASYQELVCSSGANSGEHCSGARVLDVLMTSWDCGPSTCAGWRASTLGPAYEVLTVGGDSGGPVYYNRPSDGRVSARGVIYGGADERPCPSSRIAVGDCFRTLYFVDIMSILQNQWNSVSIETTPN